MEGTTCSACPWQDTSFCFFPAPCGACSKHQLCLTPHVAEMLAKNFVPILRGSEGCLGGCCLHLLLEGSRLHLLNDFGSARRNAPSADPVKEALHWIFFFFFSSLAQIPVVVTARSFLTMRLGLRSAPYRWCCAPEPVCRFVREKGKNKHRNS